MQLWNKRISRFDTEQFDPKIAAEVSGFDPQDYMDKRKPGEWIAPNMLWQLLQWLSVRLN